MQNTGTAGLRVWAGSPEVGKSPEVRKSESPDPGPTGLGNRKIEKIELTQFRVGTARPGYQPTIDGKF